MYDQPTNQQGCTAPGSPRTVLSFATSSYSTWSGSDGRKKNTVVCTGPADTGADATREEDGDYKLKDRRV